MTSNPTPSPRATTPVRRNHQTRPKRWLPWLGAALLLLGRDQLGQGGDGLLGLEADDQGLAVDEPGPGLGLHAGEGLGGQCPFGKAA